MSKRVYKRIQHKINNMGLKMNANIFIYMRLISSIILFILSLTISNYGYIIAPISTIIYYILSEYIILDLGIKNYSKELDEYALEFFSLFELHYKYTRNIKKAIYYTTSIINNKLSNEFSLVLRDTGKSLEESLNILKNNLPNENIKTIIIAMIESSKTGINIENTLKTELDFINERKKETITQKLKVIPFKLALTCIVFLLLILMIIIFIKIYVL